MPSVFISYSHEDEPLRDALEKHLAGLKRNGTITTWHDRRIVGGERWAAQIDQHVNRDDIVLALVSASFLSSDYCYAVEMSTALKRHQRGEAVVIPVILRPCDWHESPLGKLQALPKDGKPVTTWTNSDEAFLDIVNGIKRVIHKSKERERAARPQIATPPPRDSVTSSTPVAPRSSNLGIARKFTDADKDRFLEDAFEYMARFFENSLVELKNRRPEVETRFRRIDANQFTAAIYVEGFAKTQCRITFGTRAWFGSGIAYATDLSGDRSYNECLSIEHDETMLSLRPMGMRLTGDDRKSLTQEGAAEYYWDMLIEPLKRRR